MQKTQEITQKPLSPLDMPTFLSELAAKYYKDDEEIFGKLIDCSIYLLIMNDLHGMEDKLR